MDLPDFHGLNLHLFMDAICQGFKKKNLKLNNIFKFVLGCWLRRYYLKCKEMTILNILVGKQMLPQVGLGHSILL